MADQTFVYDSQADWETGDTLDFVIAYDPAGKLIPSTATKNIAEISDQFSLAVYCRVRDGSGTAIANLGDAADGTLVGGAWATRDDDGRSYLTGGTITIPYHSSMAVADDNGYRQGQAGGIRLRMSSPSAQVLMKREGRFELGIDSNLRPYLSWVHASGTYTITAPAAYAIEADMPTVLSFGAYGGNAVLKKDGVTVASIKGLTGRNDPQSGDLVVSCTGVYSDFYLLGEYGDAITLARNQAAGSWEKVVDLGADQTLRYVEIVSKKAWSHGIGVQVAFADRKADLDRVARAYSFHVAQFETEKFYPPETGFSHGRYMRVKVSLTGRDFDAQLPIVDKLTVVTRDIGAIDYEEDDFRFNEFVDVLDYEEKRPESLEEAIKDIQDMKAAVREIKRRVSTGFHGGGGRGAGIGSVSEQYYRALVYEAITGKEPWNDLSNLSGAALLDAVEAIAVNNRVRLEALENIINCSGSDVACQDWVNDLITTHENSATAHIGTGKSITAHNDDQWAHTAAGQSLRIHQDESMGIHGLAPLDTIAGEGYVDSQVANVDADLQTHVAHTDVHGCSGGTVACQAWVSTQIDSDVAAHNANQYAHTGAGQSLHIHEGKSGGVHGVGALDTIADQDYADAQAANVQANLDTHAATSVAHKCSAIACQSWVSTQISNHNVSTGVHGVGSSHVAKSTSSTSTTETLIANHNAKSNAHNCAQIYCA